MTEFTPTRDLNDLTTLTTEELLYWRKAIGISTYELSCLSRVSNATLLNWEKIDGLVENARQSNINKVLEALRMGRNAKIAEVEFQLSVLQDQLDKLTGTLK